MDSGLQPKNNTTRRFNPTGKNMNTTNNNKCPQCSKFCSQLLLDGDGVEAKKLYKLYFYAAHQGCSVCNPSSCNPTTAPPQDVRPFSFFASISFQVSFHFIKSQYVFIPSYRFYHPILQGQLRARATLVILHPA